MAKKAKKAQLGKLAPRYRLFLNPYAYARFTKCPQCSQKTKQRKLPLVINVDLYKWLLLNKTCRYCPYDELLIVHKNELDPLVLHAFPDLDPQTVNEHYFIVGTADQVDWRRISGQNLDMDATFELAHDFKEAVIFTPMGGWGK